jgi:hypothetical protein
MDEKLDDEAGRLEFRAIAYELEATRERMHALLRRVQHTKGFRRSLRVYALDSEAPVSVQFVWAGCLGAAIESVTEAIEQVRKGARRGRR